MVHPIKAVFASCVFSRSFRYWIKRKTRQIRVRQIKLLSYQILNECPISPISTPSFYAPNPSYQINPAYRIGGIFIYGNQTFSYFHQTQFPNKVYRHNEVVWKSVLSFFRRPLVSTTEEPRYCQQGSQPILADAVKRQAAQKVGEMFDLFVARHDGTFEDADFIFGAQ